MLEQVYSKVFEGLAKNPKVFWLAFSAVAVLACIVLLPLLRPLVVWVLKKVIIERKSREVTRLRSGAQGEVPGRVFIRQTDIAELLDSESQRKKSYAEHLAANGKVLEGLKYLKALTSSAAPSTYLKMLVKSMLHARFFCGSMPPIGLAASMNAMVTRPKQRITLNNRIDLTGLRKSTIG